MLLRRLSTILAVLALSAAVLVGCQKATPTPMPPEPTSAPAKPTEVPTLAPANVAPQKEMYADFLARIGGEDKLFAPVKNRVKIGILGVSKTHEFQQSRDKGGQEAATQMGVELLLDSYESDVSIQRRKTEDLVSRGVQALISTSRDDDSWIALTDYLNKNNVLMIGEGGTADKLTREMDPNYVGYVGVSNFENAKEGGAWAANYFKKTYPGTKPLLAIANYPGSAVAIERADGFIEGFKSVMPDLEVVFNDGVGGGAGRDDVLPFIENLFTAKKFNLFFSIWDEPAIAAWTAAKARGLTNKELMIVGYDGTREVAQIITEPNSLIVADIGQNPVLSGKVCVALAAKLLNNEMKMEDIPLYLYVPGFLITPDTAQQFLDMTK